MRGGKGALLIRNTVRHARGCHWLINAQDKCAMCYKAWRGSAGRSRLPGALDAATRTLDGHLCICSNCGKLFSQGPSAAAQYERGQRLVLSSRDHASAIRELYLEIQKTNTKADFFPEARRPADMCDR